MTPSNSEDGWALCTITKYSGFEPGDPFGTTTARKNQHGEFKSIEGQTCACDPKVIAYGSWIEIEDKSGNIHKYFVCDTGADVKKRTASIARKNFDEHGEPLIVVDIFTTGDPIKENEEFGDVCRWRLVDA